jgi:hypothetical protein
VRSRIERYALAIVALVLIASAVDASASQPPSVSPRTAPADTEVARALDAVKADPNLATERTIKTLRWRPSSQQQRATIPRWLSWIVGFFTWAGESARVLVWFAAAALAGLLVVYVLRVVRTRINSAAAETFRVPTHVRDLDIRPETLPDDIGAAARDLWTRGERRAALALLYRGMLSRLAHVHGVPILDSSTEGDCLALAAARLPSEGSEYLSRLVRVWQRFGYGREDVDTSAVYHLCDEFSSALRPAPVIDGAAQKGTS